jgi:N-acetylglucosaminyldiphosphoundecaprenol N-acetyl-beta-D-mannosaminyltransferase
MVDQLDLDGAVERIRGLLESGQPHQVVTVNMDFLSIAQRNADFRETLNAADLAVADGMPLVWLSRLKGTPLPERVAGVDLVAECCALAAEQNARVFLLGAAPGIAEQAAAELEARYPGLDAHSYSPPVGELTADENDRMIRMIQQAAPRFLFVALGAPRQDMWIREHLQELDVPVAMGVGCVFDLLAGNVVRAPGWMQQAGLEWAFRLVQEPGRLWRRYLVNDLPLLGQLMLTRAESEHLEPTGQGLVAPT